MGGERKIEYFHEAGEVLDCPTTYRVSARTRVPNVQVVCRPGLASEADAFGLGDFRTWPCSRHPELLPLAGPMVRVGDGASGPPQDVTAWRTPSHAQILFG